MATTTKMRYDISKGSGSVKTVRTIPVIRKDPTTVRRVSEPDTKPPPKPAPKVARILSQDYEVIKKECLTLGALWEDASFPATSKSVYPSGLGRITMEWLRPGDICNDPQMSVDGCTRFDVKQGTLKNCWFLAAIASLCSTGNKELFDQVVPQDNLFSKDKYAGVFRFRLWQYGKWMDVVVDDRLPTVGGKLIFARSATDNEFWPALLEKAYAKLNGSYEALQGGNTSEAMQDFTGGVTENYDLQEDAPKDLFTIMRKAFERDSLMGCSLDPKDSRMEREGRLPNGLIVSHAYSVTAVKEVKVRGMKVSLIRIRNPWANECEWNGAWSDRSPEWKALSEEDKKSLGLTFEDDGEFWMSYEDFVKNFNLLEMCNAVPTASDSRTSTTGGKIRWEMTTYEGSWKKFVNAGGCRNYLNTFWTNPQFKVQVVDPDEGDEDNTGTIIVALMQKDRRKQIANVGQKMLAIGYGIYKIPDNHVGPQNINFFRYNVAVAQSPSFTDIRERVSRHKLPPGSYIIIPSTFTPNEDGDFLLRIFSENPVPSTEVDEVTKIIEKPDVKVPVTQGDRDEERDLRELFRQTAGSDLEIDAYELRTILDSNFKAEFKIDGVSLETSRSMVAMMDTDHSGKLGYDEFKLLWTDLRRWKKVFIEYDVMKKHSLSALELRAILNSSGFRVSNHTLHCLVMRYCDPKGNIHFDDFMLCVVRLKTMFEAFTTAARGSAAFATFTSDQFIQTTMYS